MQAHKIETVVGADGTIILEKLPFKEGGTVEVIILGQQTESPTSNPYPLRGTTPYRYDDPFEPLVPAEDWEALK